jgi:hypothetical protein
MGKETKFNPTRLAYQLLDGLISDTYSEYWFGKDGDFDEYTEEQREKIQEAYGRIHDMIRERGKPIKQILSGATKQTGEK